MWTWTTWGSAVKGGGGGGGGGGSGGGGGGGGVPYPACVCAPVNVQWQTPDSTSWEDVPSSQFGHKQGILHEELWRALFGPQQCLSAVVNHVFLPHSTCSCVCTSSGAQFVYQDLPSLVMQRPMKVHYAGDEIVQSELVILVAHVPDYIQTCTINILHEILTCKQNNLHLLLQHCTCVRMYVRTYVRMYITVCGRSGCWIYVALLHL